MNSILDENSVNKECILKIEGLKKYYETSSDFFGRKKNYVKAVDDISLYVNKGETLGIVGESGCGKSTTGTTILRMQEPTEGKIYFEGTEITSLNHNEMQKIRKDIQMVFQDPFSSLNPRMRVFDIIAEPLRTHKAAKGKELENIIYDLMETVGLDRSFSKRYPHEFSGGQRQRIGIARALALKPKLIVCDEPVSALDVSIQAQILNLLIDLQRKFNLTYVFIAHGIPAVKYISDRIAVMYMGEVVEMALKEDLFNETMHPYTKGLISAVPVPDPTLRDRKDKVYIHGDDLPKQAEDATGCKFYSRCPFRQQVCEKERPKLKQVRQDHFVSCHFPLQ
ncbi:ABC transporter ATP-binding protein [Cytobacillus firmus]|uniref:ABC transporter ATP-binding protein n=1 Tax=Cytobacillus firmus TaxID=1399 RepID=UPI001CFC812F|nr:oligopeptide/dipeptide ABC transporter ATP-binding protein [Cytobacillus firmus]WHY59688.1 ATP-binding cassette domain-containing protein [Cytobacillus firmus]